MDDLFEKKKNSVALQKSVGFIPKCMDKLPKDVFDAFFYSTTTSDAFTDKHILKASRSTGGLEAYRGTNMKITHGPNMVTREDYLEGPRAPQWRRTMCEYTQSFQKKPLEHVR